MDAKASASPPAELRGDSSHSKPGGPRLSASALASSPASQNRRTERVF